LEEILREKTTGEETGVEDWGETTARRRKKKIVTKWQS
jgi:hypothetical protein